MRFVGYFNIAETNLLWTYRPPRGIVSRCYEQTLRIFGDRLPPADTQKHALENEYLANGNGLVLTLIADTLKYSVNYNNITIIYNYDKGLKVKIH